MICRLAGGIHQSAGCVCGCRPWSDAPKQHRCQATALRVNPFTRRFASPQTRIDGSTFRISLPFSGEGCQTVRR